MKRIIGTIIISALSLCILASCVNKAPEYASGFAMDTVFNITVYGGPGLAGELLEAGEELDERVLSRFSEDSLLALYSSGSSDEPGSAVIMDSEVKLSDILDKCDEICVSSGGAFDVRIGALSDLWDIKGRISGEVSAVTPGDLQIRAASDDRSVYDLGAVGKGIYLDMAMEILEASDAEAAVVSAGGSILTYGEKPDGSLFRVAITDPFKDSSGNGSVATIILPGGYFVSTSGSYERYFEFNGEIYHHILDPATGYPAWCDEDVKGRVGLAPELLSSSVSLRGEDIPVSVTVIAGSGLVSDALSTACFILGPAEGMKLAGCYDSEVIYIMRDGTVITSDGIIYDAGEGTVTLAG